MGRRARPRVWRDWFVTEAGGSGIHKLCPVAAGYRKAEEELDRYLKGVEEQRRKAEAAGLVQADTPYTLAQLAAEFLQLKEATKKPGTVDFYQDNLRRFVDWYGHLDARKLRFSQAAEYINRLRKDGLGDTSVGHHVRSAKAVLNYAVEADVLIKNPWRKVDAPPVGECKRVVTDEEFEKLLKACDNCIAYRGVVTREENAQMMRDILRILRFTALRPGELRKLRWDHLDLEGGFIVIPKKEHKTGTTAKNPEDRVVPILEEATEIFLARRQRYGEQPLVFPNIEGRQWSDTQFSRRFARLREWAGLDTPDHNGENLVPKSLRHTRLTEAGTEEHWDFYSLMKFAGHTTAQMTKRYVHPSKDDLKRSAREGRRRREEREARREEE
jgi:integrase